MPCEFVALIVAFASLFSRRSYNPLSADLLRS